MKPVKTLVMSLTAAVMVFSIPALPSVAQGLGKGMASGSWTATDNMEHPRYEHTATLLRNGQVLIVGWFSNTVELYDPVADSFIPIGNSIYVHKDGVTATLLNDGKVLIAGGYDSPRNAEIYDPDTGLFTQTDSLLVEHTFQTATLLPDGRVLIVAGQHPGGPETHTMAEIYDPQSGTYTLTDSLEEARSTHTATLLPDGRVLIAGGIHTTSPGIGTNLNSCEMYDPPTGLFTTTSGMEKPRSEHTSTLLPNGKVLIAGGAWSVAFSELFDPSSDSWSRTGDMAVGHRSNHTATLLTHGHILLAGGYVESSSSSVELYDPNTNAFSRTDSMITPRSQHTATRLSDGRILVTGGYGNGALDLAELFWVDSLTVVNPDGRAEGRAPESFSLSQNYPNPFNLETSIDYSVKSAERIRISVFNFQGEQVRVLTDAVQAPGRYRISWDGLSEDGSALASGVYLIRMEAGMWIGCRKIILLK